MHIVQLAYQVSDAKVAALEWVEHHGAGPFYLSENIPLDVVHYRGALSSLDHTSAYGWCGGHMIELVQQNCDTPSVFTDRAYGLHHCAYFADELDAELTRLAELGYTIAMKASTASGIQFAFVESTSANDSNAPVVPPLGHYMEIYEEHPQLRTFYATIENASRNWDGSDPIRKFG